MYSIQFEIIVGTRKSNRPRSQGHSASVASRPSLPQRKSLKSKLSRYEALRSFTATNFPLRSGQCALHSKLCLESFFVCHILLSVVKTWTLYALVLELNFLSYLTLSRNANVSSLQSVAIRFANVFIRFSLSIQCRTVKAVWYTNAKCTYL